MGSNQCLTEDTLKGTLIMRAHCCFDSDGVKPVSEYWRPATVTIGGLNLNDSEQGQLEVTRTTSSVISGLTDSDGVKSGLTARSNQGSLTAQIRVH